jgi:glucose/arabinose dehydrogenase
VTSSSSETNAAAAAGRHAGHQGLDHGPHDEATGARTPSADRITLCRDADGDGIAETRAVFLERLTSPFGMALVGDDFYVANTDALVRFPYADRVTSITEARHDGRPAAGGPDQPPLDEERDRVARRRAAVRCVGSNSNAGERGIDAETDRAAIWEVDRRTGAHRVFAAGLRNPVGLAWEPTSQALWTAVNERDELGSDLVPDYMTSVQDGAFYGFRTATTDSTWTRA